MRVYNAPMEKKTRKKMRRNRTKKRKKKQKKSERSREESKRSWEKGERKDEKVGTFKEFSGEGLTSEWWRHSTWSYQRALPQSIELYSYIAAPAAVCWLPQRVVLLQYLRNPTHFYCGSVARCPVLQFYCGSATVCTTTAAFMCNSTRLYCGSGAVYITLQLYRGSATRRSPLQLAISLMIALYIISHQITNTRTCKLLKNNNWRE